MVVDMRMPQPQARDPRTYAIIGAAIEVHRRLGCGFVEAVYQEALELEFISRGIPFERQPLAYVHYRGERLSSSFRADFICYGAVLVEIKALCRLSGTEEAQILNYLKATGLEVGLLLNFGEASLVHRRFAHSKTLADVSTDRAATPETLSTPPANLTEQNRTLTGPSSAKSVKSADSSAHSHPCGVVEPEAFAAALLAQGYDFFTGVPCSLVAGLMAVLDADPAVEYYPETREDAAVGLACGAMMAGRQPVVVMQNSGLGVCVNALTSMALMYRTPCLLLVTWRGYQGKDAPEHIIMGEISPGLLDLIGVPHREPEAETLLDDLEWATAYQRELRIPVALLLRSGVTR